MDGTGRYGTGTVLLAALGGAAVGSAVALLLAPASGHDSRNRLVGYVDTARDTLGRVPEALKQASHAAGEALVDQPEPPRHSARK